jgi:hypothetical protein
MAVAYDTAGAFVASGSANPSYTHVLGSTANVILVACGGVNSLNFPTAVTVGGVTVPHLGTISGAQKAVQLFGLVGPPTGSQTVATTCAAQSGNSITINSVSYSGVGSIGAAITSQGGYFSGDGTLTWSPSTTGNMYVAACVTAYGLSSTAPQVTEWSNGGFGFIDIPGTGSSVTLDATSSNYDWCMVGVELIAVSGTPRSAALSGHGVLSAKAGPKVAVPCVLTGRGALAAPASSTLPWTLPIRLGSFITATAAGQGVLAVMVEPSSSAALAGHGVLSATIKSTAAAVLAGQGVLAATIKSTAAAVSAGQGALAAGIVVKLAAAGTLASMGLLSALPTPELSSVLSGHGVLSASVRPRLAAALPGRGVLVSPQGQGAVRTAAFHGHGTLSATYHVVVGAVLHGHGAPTASRVPVGYTFTAAFTGRGDLVMGFTQFANGFDAATYGTGVLSVFVTTPPTKRRIQRVAR